MPSIPLKDRKFDTQVQYLKYKVLREVARYAFEDRLLDAYTEIPKLIVKDKPTMRCCIYKERAIVEERIKLAMGGDKNNPNVIEVIDIACDECPMSGYNVSDACRGCIAHRCEDVCPRGAITFDGHLKAHIDKSKCVECGRCAHVCPYSAIVNQKRPCENACKIHAISMGESGAAHIDNDTCISCGACAYQCPFGAIMDKSFILDVVDLIKKSENNTKYKLYAVIAPLHLQPVHLRQAGPGDHRHPEAGLLPRGGGRPGRRYGGPMRSAKSWRRRASSPAPAAPAFVDYIEKQFPQLKEHISHNLSPAATIAKYIKETTPGAKIVFIGPCTAKKMEFQKEDLKPYIDSTITFEELQAPVRQPGYGPEDPGGGRAGQRLLLWAHLRPQRRPERRRGRGLEGAGHRV